MNLLEFFDRINDILSKNEEYFKDAQNLADFSEEVRKEIEAQQ